MQNLRLAVFFLALGTVECGGEGQDLPAGWSGAAALAVDQSQCEADTGMGPVGSLMLMRDMGRLRATYLNAQFRCQQRVCAFRLDEAGKTRVLVQPCDLDPGSVPKCGCLYRVGFDLPRVEAGSTVELHRRWDRYGATAEPAPMLVDSERAP